MIEICLEHSYTSVSNEPCPYCAAKPKPLDVVMDTDNGQRYLDQAARAMQFVRDLRAKFEDKTIDDVEFVCWIADKLAEMKRI